MKTLGIILAVLGFATIVYTFVGEQKSADSVSTSLEEPLTVVESVTAPVGVVVESSQDSSYNQVTQPTKNKTASLQDLSKSVVSARPYQEFVRPSAYLHTNGNPITISEHIGQKIIMISFMTYSCINCQRTFPSLVRLDEEYRDDGLLIIGIHTPEFAFEHDADRVEKELANYGIDFPVVLDNEYETWRAYGNRFWPRRYIIDKTGNIVYDHIGEGDYEGAERVIKALLPTLQAV
jgi:thiol-disulfide isomerase/thioredoxin